MGSIEFEVRINDDLESVDKSMRSLGGILSSVRSYGFNIEFLGKDKWEWSSFKVEGSNEKLEQFIKIYNSYFDLGQYN